MRAASILGIGLLSCLAVLTTDAVHAGFIETYDDGTDVGQWLCTFSQPRVIETGGGNPGMYLQQGNFSLAVPSWQTASTHFQPGVNDTYKTDSVFVGDWATAGVTSLGVDLNVLQAGAWANRPVTLEIMQMDASGFGINYTATWSTANMAEAPIGWNHYDFTVNADGAAIPSGWTFTHGDGTPGTDAEWATFLSRVDLVQFMYARPGYMYPGYGFWTLGIDNISIQTVPEPGTMTMLLALLGLSMLLRRRNHA